MPEKLVVDAPAMLQAFLRARLEGWALKTVKHRMRSGCVIVNGNSITRHDHMLQEGDQVVVEDSPPLNVSNLSRKDFTTLFADDDIIVIDKPEGLLSVSTDREQTRTALAILKESLSTPKSPANLWPVHRLDRETSGVLMFARSREMQEMLQAEWANAKKIYVAVVEGCPKEAEGEITEPLWEDRRLNVRVGHGPGSRDCCTRYKVLSRGRGRSLLELDLVTGRRHQIRAHLSWLGHPVLGDRRYGSRGRRMTLHALSLSVMHPVTGAPLTFRALPPRAFKTLVDDSAKRSGR